MICCRFGAACRRPIRRFEREGVCFQVRVLLDELNAKPRRSISSPRWKPEMVPLRCDDASSCRMPPLEKTTPLAVPPDATSSVPPLIVVAMADPPEPTISPPPEMTGPLATPPREPAVRYCRANRRAHTALVAPVIENVGNF